MWVCVNCSEQVEDDFEVCWNCQSARDGTPPPQSDEGSGRARGASRGRKSHFGSRTMTFALCLVGVLLVTYVGVRTYKGKRRADRVEKKRREYEEKIQGLIAELTSADRGRRAAAAARVSRMEEDPTPLIPHLLPLLSEKGRYTTIKILTPNPDPQTESVQMYAVWAFARIGEPAVGPLIATGSDDALPALKEIGSRAVEPLISALDDGDEKTQRLAIRALAEIPDGRSEAPLARVTEDGSRPDAIRVEAARALGERGFPGTADALTRLLRNGSPACRKEAATILRNIGGPGVTAALAQALGDPDEGVREAALDSLRRLTRKDFGGDSVKWRRWLEDEQGAK